MGLATLQYKFDIYAAGKISGRICWNMTVR